jgi:RND superfamily putative drug exporter
VQYDVPVTDFKGDEGVRALEAATAPLDEAGLQVEFGGQLPENVTEPSGNAEAVGILAAVVILFFAFGAVVAAGLPLAVAIVGLLAGTGGITLLAGFTDVSTTTPTLATMVGLGVGIDYALFVVTRHRDGLAEGLSVPEAAAQANATAGQSVVFAGGTVLLGITGLQFSGVPNFAMMGYGTAIAVFATVLAAITLLPPCSAWRDARLQPQGPPQRSPHRGRLALGDRCAPASHRGRPPAAVLVGSLVLLLGLAAPALGMRIGQSDAGSEPESTTCARRTTWSPSGFGPGANGPLVIAADLTKLPAQELGALRSTIASTPGHRGGDEPVVSPDGTAACLTATPLTGPQDAATTELVKTLTMTCCRPASEITGFTGDDGRPVDVLASNLWLVILVVIGTSLLLLLLAFRSIVVPVKAALVNLLSVGAAFGVMTLIFQTDTGARSWACRVRCRSPRTCRS